MLQHGLHMHPDMITPQLQFSWGTPLCRLLVRLKRGASHITNNTKDKVIPLSVKILCDIKEGMSQRCIWA